MNNNELAQKVIEELLVIAFSDIGDFVEVGLVPRLKSKDTMPLEKIGAVKSIESSPKGTKIQLHDKTAALAMLAKYQGILSDFNIAIATLRKYGLLMYKDPDGNWHITDDQAGVEELSQVE